ncbi:MAG: cbb3-type cytochrome c oxidase subunit I [Rhodospirillaceae bacterium]
MTEAAGLTLPAGLRREVAGWSWIAAGSLAVAGALALLLVLSRVPATQVLLPWSWQSFFYTALVTHVILSFVVWFLAVLGALAVLPLAGAATIRLEILGPAGMWAGALGTVLLALPAFLNEGEPCLNNYVPIVVHPLYYLGLGLVGLGVALPVVRLLANPASIRGSVGFGVAVSGVLYLIALLLIALAWACLPAGLDVQTFNERLFWGGGHVLQFVNTALMLTAWLLLAQSAFGEEPVPPALFKLMMASMVVFVLPGPLFYGLYDILSLQHRLAFTDLLWYGLTLPPVVVGAGLAAQLWRRRAGMRWGAAELAIGISLAVFIVGGAMGFFLGASDARTPSHYHAAIGGVNLAFMGLFLAVILPALGRSGRGGWVVPVQFHFYGWGQLVFSIGMFVAGAAGVPRKTMGAAAQGLDSTLKKVAMGVYGLGGALAVLGGVVFIWVICSRLLARGEADHG